MEILLVSYSQDPAINAVSGHLIDLGLKPIRLDTDRYPQGQMLSWHLAHGQGYEVPQSQLQTGTQRVQLPELGATWYRRVHISEGLKLTEKSVQQASVAESTLHLQYIIDQLPCPVLHRPMTNERAKNKLWQLERAVAAGLKVPPTLCTNDPEAALAFFATHDHDVVAKMLAPFAIVRGGEHHVVFTSRVDQAMISNIERLRSCPMVFQAAVPKALELRVTVVGGQVFAAAVDSQRLDKAKVDWRMAGDDLSDSWEAYALPHDIQRKLLWLVADLGLIYGAIDLILTPQGEFVFLEVNPAGEYLWLERSAALPISAAIAETLADMAYSFRHDLGMTIGKVS